VTRVLALVPDLLFGSNLQGQLAAGGHEVALLADAERLRRELDAHAAASATEDVHSADVAHAADAAEKIVLIVDLTQELDGAALIGELRAQGALAGVRTLGFYAHVNPAVRERALQAGFELVVPRSRIAREGVELVRQLSRG
jgi:DNA-binding NarL/FixJ family response regulator